jgi:hypothetical protein
VLKDAMVSSHPTYVSYLAFTFVQEDPLFNLSIAITALFSLLASEE